jgi:hypothetical protein
LSFIHGSGDSSICIATGYGVEGLAEAKDFLVSTMSRLTFGPTSPLVPRLAGLFLGVKSLDRKADHSPPSSA